MNQFTTEIVDTPYPFYGVRASLVIRDLYPNQPKSCLFKTGNVLWKSNLFI
ncbi:hypothetical protein [Terrilactibacillus tamarindi]|uniref:hypothetical protein n=1 Tax=Terrilactibacillus tamarindi TaxID=2599694 RepID=UPI001E2E9531|nr:hypothetical protein [Terrilactibacillus tamarindi]